jgi:arginine-tRNA-protein transferase
MDNEFIKPKTLRFFKTKPTPCPYLEGQKETKAITILEGDTAYVTHKFLLEKGFRRSQNFAYKPICENCNACISVRIEVDEFIANKTQKRVLKKGEHLIRRITPPVLTDEQFNLFSSYVLTRHGEHDMANMSYPDVRYMVEETSVNTRVIEYRTVDNNILVGWTISDFIDNGISMVYSVYDVNETARSPGIYAILDHINMAKKLQNKYIYLGYWVKNSVKMAYKGNFDALELFENNLWKKRDKS